MMMIINSPTGVISSINRHFRNVEWISIKSISTVAGEEEASANCQSIRKLIRNNYELRYSLLTNAQEQQGKKL